MDLKIFNNMIHVQSTKPISLRCSQLAHSATLNRDWTYRFYLCRGPQVHPTHPLMKCRRIEKWWWLSCNHYLLGEVCEPVTVGSIHLQKSEQTHPNSRAGHVLVTCFTWGCSKTGPEKHPSRPSHNQIRHLNQSRSLVCANAWGHQNGDQCTCKIHVRPKLLAFAVLFSWLKSGICAMYEVKLQEPKVGWLADIQLICASR